MGFSILFLKFAKFKAIVGCILPATHQYADSQNILLHQ